MKTSAYDLVQKWKRKYPSKTMAEAFEATRVSPGTYYAQKQKVEKSRVKRVTALQPTYDVEVLDPMSTIPGEVRPGVVALVGAPEDVAKMLLAMKGGDR